MSFGDWQELDGDPRPAPNVPFDLGPPDAPADEPETEPRDSEFVTRDCGCIGTRGDRPNCVHVTAAVYDLAAYNEAFKAWQEANPGYGVSWYSGPPAPRLEQFPIRTSVRGAA